MKYMISNVVDRAFGGKAHTHTQKNETKTKDKNKTKQTQKQKNRLYGSCCYSYLLFWRLNEVNMLFFIVLTQYPRLFGQINNMKLFLLKSNKKKSLELQ